MTIKELIEKLKIFEEDKSIWVYVNNRDTACEIEEVVEFGPNIEIEEVVEFGPNIEIVVNL